MHRCKDGCILTEQKCWYSGTSTERSYNNSDGQRSIGVTSEGQSPDPSVLLGTLTPNIPGKKKLYEQIMSVNEEVGELSQRSRHLETYICQ